MLSDEPPSFAGMLYLAFIVAFTAAQTTARQSLISTPRPSARPRGTPQPPYDSIVRTANADADIGEQPDAAPR